MEAPRQKLMKESATVVATTTFDVDDGSLPSVGDIRWLYSTPLYSNQSRKRALIEILNRRDFLLRNTVLQALSLSYMAKNFKDADGMREIVALAIARGDCVLRRLVEPYIPSNSRIASDSGSSACRILAAALPMS